MSRISLKIVGASGQGIDSIGEIVAKALKRSGYCIFGYREYPSLIKGGHASYQLDISNEHIESTETTVNVLIALNHHGLQKNLTDLKPGGILIHDTANWKFTPEQQTLIDRLSLRIIELPIDGILAKLQARPILANVILTAFVWAVLGQDIEALKKMTLERFAKKKNLLDLNMRCIEEGFAFKEKQPELVVAMPKPSNKWKNCLLLTGSKAMGLGAVRAGVRVYAGYPMTPSSPLLTYIAAIQNATGMAVKQAEDEITAAQFVSGAMFAGTRALTATAGGGFDLMTETLSMNGIIENPTVFVLAQRPGPGTGLPTWTGQADLMMAIASGHGEFTRCVMAVSGSGDGFQLMNDAFNIAEQYQISVIVLADKQITEALYTQEPYDQKQTVIKRGPLVTDPEQLKKLKSTDRYDPQAKDGISARWLPGTEAATFNAQADEHDGEGTTVESSENAIAQISKRIRKGDALIKELPEPELIGCKKPEVLLVSWGSTRSVIVDLLEEEAMKEAKVGYLHYAYLWPLKTDLLMLLMKKAKKVILVEGNALGQLGMLIRQQTGMEIKDKVLKFDGRPFFIDELFKALTPLLPPK